MRKTIYILLAALTLSISANAQQNLRTAYFLDGYTYSYKFNPAFQGERGFLAIPVVGKTGVGVESGLALSTFLYPTADGKLATFMHPSVSSEDFLGSLKDLNRMNLNLDVPVFALGFYTGDLYHTIDISAKADAGFGVPKTLFSFMKEGSANGIDAWDITNIGARADARLELAYGISRRLFDFINVGARFKVLVGLMHADLMMNNVNLKMAADEWAVAADGQLKVNGIVGIEDVTDLSTITYPTSIEEFKNIDPSVGYAIDLGVSVDFLEYFTASASILDLGAIKWTQGFNASTPDGVEPWVFSGFEDLPLNGIESFVNEQLTVVADDLMDMFNITQYEQSGADKTNLGATAHIALEARMPFYERLSFGVLGTHRFNGPYSWTEGRFSANVAPLRSLSASCSYAISDFGRSLGAALNLHAGGLTLFAGVDSILPFFNVTPQYIPVESWNTNLTLGMNLTLGTYRGRFPKTVK
ncbi:MAG: hypothetical protein IIX08_06800 [Bacteroidales bacterium]|nr:hypothetical protein [Bacteroidales bacterium]